MLLLFSLQILGANAGAEEGDAAFDLNVDFDAMHYGNSDPMADNASEDLAPEWDRNRASTGRGAPESPGS